MKVEFMNFDPVSEGVQDETFKCYRLRGKNLEFFKKNGWLNADDKEIVLPLCGYEHRLFVYGVGYIKINEKNVIDVPRYDLEVEHWDEYMDQWGPFVLYYSLTRQDLFSRDCCYWSTQCEFKTVMRDMWRYPGFVERVKRLCELQRPVLEMLIPKQSYMSDSWHGEQISHYMFRPSYQLMGFVIGEPMMRVVEDDGNMESLYRKKRNEELRDEMPDYHDRLAVIDKEIKDGVFPVCMEERVKYWFGEECARLYAECLDWYKQEAI